MILHKRALLLMVFILPLQLYAQFTFTITGHGDALKEGDMIYLSYKQSSGHKDDSTVVRNKTFSFKGTANTIVRGYISRNANPKYAEFLHDSYDIYIEPGNIVLASKDTLNNAAAKGTPSNEDYARLRALTKSVNQKLQQLKDPDKLTAGELKDTAYVKKVSREYLAVLNEFTPLHLQFAKQNPDAYVSLIILQRLARTSHNLPQVEEIFNTFSARLKGLPEGKDIANSILIGKKVQVGMVAKDFTQPDIAGRPVKLSDYRGKYVLVDFWASWCLPCREENPNLVAAYQKYKARGFDILGVSIDRAAAKPAWLYAIKQDQLPWTQVSDLKVPNAAHTLYGISTIPANVLIDPQGIVIAKDLKGEALHKKLEELFGK